MDKTLSAYRELGPKRYRETSGLYYEDFEVGEDGMEEAAGGQHIHARSAHRHERPHGECQGRRQPRLGQGKGNPSGFCG